MGKLHAHARVALQAKELDHSREVESLRRRLDSVLAQHDAASDDFRAREARASEALGHQASALASLQQRHGVEVAELRDQARCEVYMGGGEMGASQTVRCLFFFILTRARSVLHLGLGGLCAMLMCRSSS